MDISGMYSCTTMMVPALGPGQISQVWHILWVSKSLSGSRFTEDALWFFDGRLAEFENSHNSQRFFFPLLFYFQVEIK